MKTFQWILETGGEIETPEDITEEEAKKLIRESLLQELTSFNDSIIVWEK